MNSDLILGIYREHIYSPGKIQDDAAILDATLRELSGMGYGVEARRAESLNRCDPRPGIVLSMAQSMGVLDILEDWGAKGARVINSVQSVRSCYRGPLLDMLLKSGINMPRSRMVSVRDVHEQIDWRHPERFWFKRGDVHAIQAGDVASVASREEMARALDHFRTKGIPEILVQDHLDGPVVKFYGVGQGGYFRAYLAETGEDVTAGVPALRDIAKSASRAVGLDVYGGDAVMTNGNRVALIDLNDWPSFSRCCQTAAMSIAGYVAGKIRQ